MSARPAPTLMVVDDDPRILNIVERHAKQLGYHVVTHNGGTSALASLASVKPDVAVVDLRMPDMGGLDVLRAIRRADPECQVILMTAEASIDTAVEAIKAGALDYVTKPFEAERLRHLLVTVRDAIERRVDMLRADSDAAKQFEFHGLIGRSPVMEDLFSAIRRFAPHARTVLVTGETGTGKELVARALHALGPRRDRRLVTVNCSAVVDTLFESELFGHVRGAFTGATENKVGVFEHAGGATLFLDEVGELPLSVQAKLLRAVEYGEFQRVGALETKKADVWLIAATNRNLRAESAAGRFRSDLFYRMSIVEIQIPPLRDRREDIPYLTAGFIREASKRMSRSITGVTASAERLLRDSTWPGNVRELKNAVERACILADGGMLTEREFAAVLTNNQTESEAPPDALPVADDARLSTAQRDQILRVLREVRGNKSLAAKRLGVSRRSLYRWLERLDVDTH